MTPLVRRERPEDARQILAVIEAAFEDRSVAEFAEAIRVSAGYVADLSFVADDGGAVVGHTMLSRVGLVGHADVLVLTPMAVRPDRQGQGIGATLVKTALDAADEQGEPLVLVEGIPAYYPRFGFRSATALGLLRPDPRIPDAAWMAIPLRTYDPGLRGRVVYPPFFPGPPADA